jgi:hypothetical protein
MVGNLSSSQQNTRTITRAEIVITLVDLEATRRDGYNGRWLGFTGYCWGTEMRTESTERVHYLDENSQRFFGGGEYACAYNIPVIQICITRVVSNVQCKIHTENHQKLSAEKEKSSVRQTPPLYQ